jgi:glutamate/tyrosine decarboxylase-like PLP-dependent enzyme
MFSAPFDVFAELAAGVWFVQDPRVHVDAALGGRFWF